MRPNWLGSGQAAAGRGIIEVKFYVEPKMPIVRNGGYRNVIGHVIGASSDLSQSRATLQRAADCQLVDYAVSDRHTADRRGRQLPDFVPTTDRRLHLRSLDVMTVV